MTPHEAVEVAKDIVDGKTTSYVQASEKLAKFVLEYFHYSTEPNGIDANPK